MYQEKSLLQYVFFSTGFVLSYFIFTTILYSMLFFLKKLPLTWSYVHIAEITLGITVIGLILQRWLQ